ncbi:MAG: DNA gyrase/topoisomerase IV subunit A [Bacteroidales bacterium]|nr:DNA gyrase/topoisomerase IV subunit A [Bacteroidales bacterium]NLK81692.1 DNA gyrase/topoisomerase IV subunit A [Bacteroidales bacterium]
MSEREENELTPDGEIEDSKIQNIKYITGHFKDWFLDYASYVIMERAVPYINDGLKPVQRRLLHSMKRMDDGRYNKVANIIGHTMQFHPHGDASIGDALVGLGQKDLLIDTQGNWGNILTGDNAAAPRYIEARLSKFANDVVFNPKTTLWKSSYDGRNKEPITLPVKFPLLLAQGVEGIAVGMASKILPHNFIELIDACIKHLKGQKFELYPDFPTGGLLDVSRYNDGVRGGQIKVRARINKIDNRTLVITEIPFGKTTSAVIDSILRANERGTIKVRKVDDNTAANVEIIIYLPTNVSADETIDALYVFTDCETSISPNSTIIVGKQPEFIGVSEILRHSANQTVDLLKQELNIRINELKEDWMKCSLEKIFIEKEIYELIKPCKTEEEILTTIFKGLQPYIKGFWREVTLDDCTKLSNIPIKRISKYSASKTDELIKGIEVEMEEVQNHIDHIIDYTITYYTQIKKKYGAGRERKTEIRNFEQIQATQVVIANTKLYANKADGFVGTGLRKDEFICECSDIDDIIVFQQDGSYKIAKVSEKAFFGKNIIHIGVFRRGDDRTIYNTVYRDGKTGISYMKRFAVTSVSRDREYTLTKGSANSKVLYFSTNPNGEAEIIRVYLKSNARLRKSIFEVDFSTQIIKGRNSQGNILTKHSVLKIIKIEEGVSTLSGRKIYFNFETKRLNDTGYGDCLGEFKGSDKILVITKDGKYSLTTFDLSNHYEIDIHCIEKFNPQKQWSAVFFDAEQKYYYIKRFKIEDTNKYVSFIGEHEESKFIAISDDEFPQIEIQFGGKHAQRENEYIDVEEFIAVKGFKARGKRATTYTVKKITFTEPLNKNNSTTQESENKDDNSETNDPSKHTEPPKKPFDNGNGTPNQMSLF